MLIYSIFVLSNSDGYTIQGNNIENLTINNVVIENHTSGYYLNNSKNCVINNTKIQNMGLYGIRIQYSNNCTLMNIIINTI